MALIHEPARAKVNLTLRVLGKRVDGYHELVSLVAFASRPADQVTLDTDGPVGVTVEGPRAAALAGGNILDKALERLAAAAPRLQLGAVRLEKHLPVAAGIGGGSADAAALLRAVRRANPERGSAVDWGSIAASLGADVPVCLAGVATMMRGVGDRLSPVAAMPALPAVLVNPQTAVPADKTAQVFRRLGAKPLGAAFRTGDGAPDISSVDALIATLRAADNDLEPAALQVMPEIAQVLDALAQAPGVLLARMSGAGPTCFALFETAALADQAAATVRAARPAWWIEAAVLG